MEIETNSGLGPANEVAAGTFSTCTSSTTVSTVNRTDGRKSLRRRVLIRLAFVAISLFVSVAVVETLGRLIFRDIADDATYYSRLETNIVRSGAILEPTRTPGTFHPKFGAVLSPSATVTRADFGRTTVEHTNSLGFRTREVEPRMPGEYRILIVGDSYLYGAYLNEDESIGARLEGLRDSDPKAKRPLRVYNFSIYGYCGVQELLVARTYASVVQPDMIILGFFAANDLIPNALTRIDENGNFSPMADQIERFRHELRAEMGPWRHSLIARFVYLTGPAGTRTVYRLGRQPWALEKNFELLGQFQSLCRQRKCQFGVVFLHTTDSLDSGWRAALYPSDDVQRPLSAFCVDSGIPFVDTRAEFLAAGDWRPFILEKDAHYSALGVRKTAQAIYRQWARPEMIAEGKPVREDAHPSTPGETAEAKLKSH